MTKGTILTAFHAYMESAGHSLADTPAAKLAVARESLVETLATLLVLGVLNGELAFAVDALELAAWQRINSPDSLGHGPAGHAALFAENDQGDLRRKEVATAAALRALDFLRSDRIPQGVLDSTWFNEGAMVKLYGDLRHVKSLIK
jgi:hypothetical protein